jgi:hypothetical protein
MTLLEHRDEAADGGIGRRDDLAALAFGGHRGTETGFASLAFGRLELELPAVCEPVLAKLLLDVAGVREVCLDIGR